MMKLIFEIALYLFAMFGGYVFLQIIWYKSEDSRYNLKTKLFPKWKAHFKVGDYVNVKDGNDKDTLCKVEHVWAEKNRETGNVDIWYIVKPTSAFNGSGDYKDYYFEQLNLLETDLREVW